MENINKNNTTSKDRREGEADPATDPTLNVKKGSKPGPLSSKRKEKEVAQPAPGPSGTKRRATISWAKGVNFQVLLKGLTTSATSSAASSRREEKRQLSASASEPRYSCSSDIKSNDFSMSGELDRKRKREGAKKTAESEKEHYPTPCDSEDEDAATDVIRKAQAIIMQANDDPTIIKAQRARITAVWRARNRAIRKEEAGVALVKRVTQIGSSGLRHFFG